MPANRVIHIRPEAPAKPSWSAACNGCGVCCLAEPCPLGAVLSLRIQGPCKALRWDESERNYRCGALGVATAQGVLARLRAKLVARWIAAGSGCDCALELSLSCTIPGNPSNDADPPHD